MFNSTYLAMILIPINPVQGSVADPDPKVRII